MTTKQKFQKVLGKLKLGEKASKGQLTNKEWNKIAAAYKSDYGSELAADMAADKQEEPLISASLQAQIKSILAEDGEDDNDPDEKKKEEEQNIENEDDDPDKKKKEEEENAEDDEEDPDKKKEEEEESARGKGGINATLKKLVGKVKHQEALIKKLSGEPEAATPKNKVKMDAATIFGRVIGRSAHTQSHLFGISEPFFARSKWYNEIAVTRKEIGEGSLSLEQKKEFQKDFSAYTSSLKNRIAYLSVNNLLGSLNYKQLIADGQSNINYDDLFDKAGEYIVRRQDAIIAYMRSLPGVADIFPVVSNIQNKEIAPGANFGELSQGYRSGRIFKGNVNFTAEIYSVIDVMFKFKFTDMIALEKQYIGYLNREGANVIKWTFIEWIIVHFGEILVSEQNRRRVIGIRVPQQNVISNPAMLAADGVLRAIERVEEELKVLPFEDLRMYDESTIIDYLKTFYNRVEQILPNMNSLKLYVNQKHFRWYIDAYRERYAKDNDFNGTKGALIDVLDPNNIVWVPNMDINCYKAWITAPDNVECYEDKPNEMLAFYFERDFEDILTMSRWKEGAGLQMAGIQYKTIAELRATGRKNQWIFTNAASLQLAANATTVDGSLNTVFETVDNTAATALTDITNPSIERVYKIVCSGTANATTIGKAGKFAKIVSAWTPTAVGDYIKVYAELEDVDEVVDGQTITTTKPTGNWLELERKVTTP